MTGAAWPASGADGRDAAPRVVPSAVQRSPLERTTAVDLFWVEKQTERWIRFGHPLRDDVIDRRRRRLSFAPNSIFAFVRWASNDYGTLLSRLDIVRAVLPGEAYSTLPCVSPGGEFLLHLASWARVRPALERIDAVEALGVDPAFAAPDYWRHVHNRLTAGHAPRSYSLARHRAWLLRRELGE